jgi:antimicrobial peptide system SdpB family protein
MSYDVGVPLVSRHLQRAESRTVLFAVARSVLAVVQFGVLALNSDSVLLGSPGGPRAACKGIAATSLWCVTGTSSVGFDIARALALSVLFAVTIGYRASWSCIPHWYVSVSMSACFTPIDGGSYAAQAAALLLIPACLGDGRRWQWDRSGASLAPRWYGRRAAALLAMRCQVAVIYGEAAISKIAHSGWRDGRAMAAVLSDPQFGLPDFAKRWLGFLIPAGDALTVSGWMVVVGELSIAILIMGTLRMRRVAAGLAVILHTGILVFMGLLPFGLTMCAVVLLAASERRAAPPSTGVTVRTSAFIPRLLASRAA